MFIIKKLSVVLAFSGVVLAVPYSEYILAPQSRTLYPRYIHSTTGSVAGTKKLLGPPNGGLTTFHNVSSITYDFGQTVEGIVSLDIASTSKSQSIGVTFTESSSYIFPDASDSTDNGLDVPLWFTGAGEHTAAPQFRRGAFRYLTVGTNGTGTVKLSSLSVHFTAYPDAPDDALGAYAGYFHSNDEELNLVWYAGAWTCQLCVIDPKTGDAVVHAYDPVIGAADGYDLYPWYNNITVSNGTSVLVDGAKRDRLVWPGDFAVSITSSFVSFGDLAGVRNGLDSLYALQNSSGALPYTGTPIWENLFEPAGVWSYTYHVHTLSDLYQYYLYTGDKTYLKSLWKQAVLGLEYSLSKIDGTGLALLPDNNADWGRANMGGYNIEANSLLYRATLQYIALAEEFGQTTQVEDWHRLAIGIKDAANTLLWNEADGLYNDNTTTTFHPQDGNVLAMLSGIADRDRAAVVAQNLQSRWTPLGPPAPEAGSTISPFITSLELQAHFLVSEPQRSIDLMKSMYYQFMMNDPRMTNSTFIEGYSINGSLIYAYADSPRLSFTHGWSTGPTSTLSQYVVGIQFLAAAGRSWLFAPQVGNLTSVEGGYGSPLGIFEAKYTAMRKGLLYEFVAPVGTYGSVTITKPLNCVERGGRATLRKNSGKFSVGESADAVELTITAGAKNFSYGGLTGAAYAVLFSC